MAYDLRKLFRIINSYLLSSPRVSLQELSRRTGVERHTIEKAVRMATGMTFRELRNRMMLEEARRLLEDEPNRSIKEIAFMLNYRSQRAFSRFMRTMAGNSPSELRRDHRVRKTLLNKPC